MVNRKSLNHPPSLLRKLEKNPPSIRLSRLAYNQTCLLASIAEFYNRVMAQAQALGRIADRCLVSIGNAGNLKQKLMLLRMQPMPLGRLLTKVKKQPQLVAKFSQYLKPDQPCRRLSRSRHSLIIS